jgi:hypothetical protein
MNIPDPTICSPLQVKHRNKLAKIGLFIRVGKVDVYLYAAWAFPSAFNRATLAAAGAETSRTFASECGTGERILRPFSERCIDRMILDTHRRLAAA